MAQSFNEADREMLARYGKMPTHKNLLSQKLKERKYFDSGDYAMQKAGVATSEAVGTAIPSPADIPHASSPSSSAAAATSLSSSPSDSRSGSMNSNSGFGASFMGQGGQGGGVGAKLSTSPQQPSYLPPTGQFPIQSQAHQTPISSSAQGSSANGVFGTSPIRHEAMFPNRPSQG